MRQLLQKVARRFIAPAETLDGYESPELIEVVFRKTKIYEPAAMLPLGGARTVMDFGGGCGLHYKQARSPDVRWAVVETPAMVARAGELATDNLRFFTRIADAYQWLGDIDVMHSNGALQYTPDPERTLAELCSVNARQMLWHRVALSSNLTARDIQASLLGDNGPGSFHVKEKTVLYPRILIPESVFLAAHANYRLIERGADAFRFVTICE